MKKREKERRRERRGIIKSSSWYEFDLLLIIDINMLGKEMLKADN